MPEELLPSMCKDHPKAQIKHEWDRTFIRNFNGDLVCPVDSAHKYVCAECGAELCSPEEYERRCKIEALAALAPKEQDNDI